ncbi:MAG: hypothetical protein EPN98_10370 [Phenylobacterium sp.]|uniref:hypothetical protein n=1 Tax=Phenylobacterium sp. TaxID=1871053 RepID=UPI001224966F|nr:hypothetical protein [Phenylobacterium sp.]TAL34373.1 MAG: hypothetical protein EPN98_10370 [Phenylobacterium sp.]
MVWWTERGFLSLLFLIGVVGLFGAVVTGVAGDAAFEQQPWLWGIAWLLAAAANWIGGARLNRSPINPLRGKVRDRLTYRARNRFLSFPMEVWSAPAALLGAVLIIQGLV